MEGFSSELYQRCRTTMLQCSEFDSDLSLRAVFVTNELRPFRSGLPSADNPSELIDRCLDYLVDKRLSDGRPVLPVFLVTLRDRYQPGDALRDELSELISEVESTLASSGVTSIVSPIKRRRRIDSAVPSCTEFGQHIDLLVQVRFPDSPLLGIKDWPTKRIPSSIEQEHKSVTLRFPLDPETGEVGSARLEVEVVASDFKLEGEPKQLVEVPPDEFSECILFYLVAMRSGICRINIIVRSVDGITLGTIPLETAVGEVSVTPTAIVASMLLIVVVEPVAVAEPDYLESRTVVQQVTQVARDPAWQGLGAIVGILACIIALLAIPPVQDLIKSTLKPTPILLHTTTNVSVDLRSGPGIIYDVITTLGPDQVLTVTGRIADASWLRVNTMDVEEGWVPNQEGLMAWNRPPERIPIVTPPPTPTPTLASVTILSPSEGQEVSSRTYVHGTASNVPGDRQLWVLVQKGEGDGYYPQPGPIEIQSDGTWETLARVGSNSDLEWHKPYKLIVVAANAGASQKFEEFVEGWPTGQDKGLDLPAGADALASVGVIRVNPIISLASHTPGAKMDSRELMTGTYLNLEPGNWHLYGVIEAEDNRFVPYGPFEPQTSQGQWAIDVEFPWPADGTRNLSFYTLTVLTDTPSDEILRSSVGSPLSAGDLPSDSREDIYGPLTQMRLTRAERIAFASDKPGNDDIFVINSDGSGLARLTNDDAEDLDPAWSPDGTQIVFASEREGTIQLFVMDADGKNVSRMITDTAMPARAPNWSPNGQWIAFHSEQGGNLDIYKVRPDGTDLTRLTTAPARDIAPAWSPTSDRILFLSDRAEGDAGSRELYVMNADGSGVTRLTDNESYKGYASWSPDGQRILFVSDMEGSQDIYLMNADGTNVTWVADVDYDRHPTFAPDGRGQRFVFDSSRNRGQLFLATLEGGEPVQIETGLAKSWWPAWSPVSDDQRIAFVGRFDGDWEIYTMWDDGTDMLRLTDTDSNEVQPRISPDGRQVAFVSDIDGDYEIWLEDARTPEPWIQLTDNTSDDFHPAWSPDGRKLAFASDRDGDWDIYVMNNNATGLVQLTDDSAEDSFPAWSPDGTRIAFYSERSGDGDIYVMDAADGGNVTPLVENPGFDWSPAWSPDGHALIFASSRDHGGTYAKDLYALELLSGALRRLTDRAGYEAIPLWSSDGQHIYFTSDRDGGVYNIWVMYTDGSEVRNLTEDDRSDTFGGP